VTRGIHEVWVEIGALACCLGGLFFFTIASYQLSLLLAHWMLTGQSVIVVDKGLALGWREQAVGIIALALPGVALLGGGWALRLFLAEEGRGSEERA
jgi:hypothetical protein